MLNLDEVFSRKKAQKDVAEFLLRKGIRVTQDRRFFFGEIEVSSSAIARALGLDRRAVVAAAETIAQDPELMSVYGKLNSTLLLKDVASAMGFGAIEIIPKDPSSTGIIANVTRLIAESHISVRQIITDDPMFKNAEMTVVTEKPIPGELIERILKLADVEKVIVIS
ncbi:MAG: hypothetical protein JW724_06670 [Candidatus Altiarchaeota archaeon]|nr:hypothetical protein [Candidatus Altiarchaeota archaeon]